MKQFPNTPAYQSEKGRDIWKYERSSYWFFRDDEKKIQPYNYETINRINKELQPSNPSPSRSICIKIGKHEYEIDLVDKKQKNVETAKCRDIYSEDDLKNMRDWPIEFNIDPPKIDPGSSFGIKELSPTSDEYKNVVNYFYMHMPSQKTIKTFTQKSNRKCNIIKKVEKIYNPRLRTQWEFLLKKIHEDNNNKALSSCTKLLWHGSGDLAPSVIYSDVHYGWKINYASEKNLWGRGLYFGEDASYCHKYTYKTSSGSRQVFLAEVITGDDIISLEDSTIKEPWEKEEGKVRYDSVCGVRHETSWIWVVYASGRAYPLYLVEYMDNE